MRTLLIIATALSLIFVSCKDDKTYIPKPRMFPKVDYPTKDFQAFDIVECPFELNVPTYFKYSRDTFELDADKNKCWFDLYCSELNAYLHLSYLDINNRKEFDQFVKDAFELVDKHNIKANYRDEKRLSYPDKNVHGLMFEIDGPVATPLQFFVTDSTSHFFRGSLYFKSRVDRDSLAPVYSFLKEDVIHLLDNFEWN